MTSRFLLVLDISGKKEGGCGMTSRFLLVLRKVYKFKVVSVRPIKIYRPWEGKENVVWFLLRWGK